MKKSVGSMMLISILSIVACQPAADTEGSGGSAAASGENPFFTEWDTPFGVPPLDQIGNDHYLPAFEAAMAAHQAEIEVITATTDEPTFDNTIVALERSGAALGRVSRVFFSINSANTNDRLEEIASTVSPQLAAHRDDITLNADLYARVKSVFDARDELGLDAEQLRLLEETHKTFVRSGVNLPEESKPRLREINTELAELGQKFGQHLLADTNAFELHVTDEADLGALPEGLRAAAANEAESRGHDGGWSFTLQRPSINPFLQYSPNRELRREIYTGYLMRGDNDDENDNKEIIARMTSLRAEKAELMGYETWAHFVLEDAMAKSPDRVYELLDQVWAPALAKSKVERADIEEMLRADGIEGKAEGWDWRHYTEQVRKAKYELDEEALRPYFELTAVRDGAFMLATQLWGLTFEELEGMPVWNEDQQVFEVKDADGSHLGILYMDFFIRESKRGGAWMNELRPQSRLDGEVTPVVTTNFNFPPVTADTPSLLSFGEAATLFHEFGHAVHGLLSDTTYQSLSGTNVPRDFVEFPSQVMENWMSEPEVLRMYAKHYETGEVIPDELIDKITASATFNQGFATVEYMAAAYLDMAWHTLADSEARDVRSFEIAEMARIGLIEQIPPRYRSTYFGHITGGYSAGYYSYLWSEILDADAFQAFKETSVFDQETAARYRHLLAQGGSKPGMDLYVEFRGREPEIGPLLERRGLAGN